MFRIAILALLATIVASHVPADAGLIFLSGDVNIGNPLNDTYTSPNQGNSNWFKNILGSGTTVLIQNQYTGPSTSINLAEEAIGNYYNSLTDVTCSTFDGIITPSELVDVDLFISMIPQDHYSNDEVAALSGFLSADGSLLLMGENFINFYESNFYINTLLVNLGSSLKLDTDSLTGNFQQTTNIENNPFNLGVDTITYAYTNTVIGGTPLLRTIDSEGAKTFVAYEVAPEPGSGLLLLAGLACILHWGRDITD